MSCEEGLAHPWMEKFSSGDVTATKSLSKEKMKKFLIAQKWKVRCHPQTHQNLLHRKWWLHLIKTHVLHTESRQGRAGPEENGFVVQKWQFRIFHKSWKGWDNVCSFQRTVGPSPLDLLVRFCSLDVPLSPEAERALQSLEQKMQGPPQFTKSLEEQTVAQGSCARLSCHLTGTHQLLAQKMESDV